MHFEYRTVDLLDAITEFSSAVFSGRSIARKFHTPADQGLAGYSIPQFVIDYD
jgi:hypothetical protein